MSREEIKKGRDFTFTEKDFRIVQKLVAEHAGIQLSEAKKDLVYSRLSRRLRQLKIDSFKSYLELLHDDQHEEWVDFTNAITTNLTSFFRENHHFEFLGKKLLPSLMEKKQRDKRLRIWSAGCSTGEEVYSIAMTIKETVPQNSGWDVKILATDLDSNVVATGKAGIYGEERVQGLPKPRLRRWFMRGKGENSGWVRVKPELQQMVDFRQMNLLQPWPIKGPFDIIFCRNVVIYFNKDTQKVLFNRYADILAPDGHLFIGHSESLFKVSDRFDLLGQTIYRRIK
jgi:chemotaxis protein methyltransferase CheR